MKLTLLAIGGIIGLVHLTVWLLTKGTIFVMYRLFDINWYGEFWIVYLLLILISCIFGRSQR